MATVRCPNCQRALHLPDDREVQMAQCPLCQTTFEAAHKAIPLIESLGPRAETIAPLPPVPREVPRELPETRSPRDFEFDDQEDSATVQDRKALQSAAGWLKTMAGLGLGHLVTCGCCELGMLDRPQTRDLIGFVMFFMFAIFAALCVVWSGADAMSRRRNYGLVMTANCVALIAGGLLMLIGVPICLGGIHSLDTRGDSADMIQLISGLLRFVAGLCGVVGALKGLNICQSPRVQAMFGRRR